MFTNQKMVWIVLLLGCVSCGVSENVDERFAASRLVLAAYEQFSIASVINVVNVRKPEASRVPIKVAIVEISVVPFDIGAKIPVAEVVSRPEFGILANSVGRWTLADGTVCPVANVVGWRPMEERYSGFGLVDWNVPIGLFASGINAKWVLQYKVRVEIGDEDHTYKAVAFVSDEPKGTNLRILDSVIDGSSLTAFNGVAVDKCLEALPTNVPSVYQDFLSQIMTSKSMVGDCVQVDAAGLCCDIDALRCGLRRVR